MALLFTLLLAFFLLVALVWVSSFLAQRSRIKKQKLETLIEPLHPFENPLLHGLISFQRERIEDILGPPSTEMMPGVCRHFQKYFTSEEVEALFASNMAVIGNEGGLLVGRSHAQGGIPVLQKLSDGLYKLFAEFEGYEYLLNPGVTAFLPQHCEAANKPDIDKQFDFEEYLPGDNITVLDVRADGHPAITKCLVLDSEPSFFVVNKHSTTIKLSVLEQLNNLTTYNDWKEARRREPVD